MDTTKTDAEKKYNIVEIETPVNELLSAHFRK